MHFSTSVLLSSVFSLSFALPSGLSRDLGNDAPVARPGRLNVTYESKAIFSQVSALYGDPVASQPFTIKAYNSESAIHLMNITASYNKFWVGNVTGNRCPPPAVTKDAPWAKSNECPAGNETALEVTGTGEAHLDVVVKGGQAIYLGPHAQLRFNNAGVPLPADAIRMEFALSVNPIPPSPEVSAFIYSGVGKASGYLACPVAPEGPWQVFADLASIQNSWVPSGDVSDCIGFDALAMNYTSPTPAAYEYV
ncbi:MAG: hypothetical protein Q9184_007645 [Pyrenodesmia sp. 2 TL-2023]